MMYLVFAEKWVNGSIKDYHFQVYADSKVMAYKAVKENYPGYMINNIKLDHLILNT